MRDDGFSKTCKGDKRLSSSELLESGAERG